MTIGVRVAITFAVLFLVSGAGLLAVNYAVLAHSLQARYAPVPSYPASFSIGYDRALISNPQTPVLDQAAARGQLAFVLAHPTQRFSGALLPQLTSAQDGQSAQAHGYDQALSQLLRQSTLILVPLALLAVVLGWLVARRMLRPVRQLTATARQMSAANLSQRLQLAEGTGRHLRPDARPARYRLRIPAALRGQRLA
jgi:parvulin-like peptidyl-prolyl isomerase